MPRIQILDLPGGVDDYPFAVVIDQMAEGVDRLTAEGLAQFKANVGAKAVLVTPQTIEVVR